MTPQDAPVRDDLVVLVGVLSAAMPVAEAAPLAETLLPHFRGLLDAARTEEREKVAREYDERAERNDRSADDIVVLTPADAAERHHARGRADAYRLAARIARGSAS